MASDHLYSIYLSPDDPQAGNPDKILTMLKPHQRAGLAKAILLETTGAVSYNVDNPEDYVRNYRHYNNHMFRGIVHIKTNGGIIGDIVGYGKTLLALAIIAQTPTSQISRNVQLIKSVSSHNMGVFNATTTRASPRANDDSFIRTTLVVVPRGPVYVQWDTAIRTQTRLKVLSLDSLHAIRRLMPSNNVESEEIKRFLEGFDVVLVKNTTFPTLINYYPNYPDLLSAWDRVMIDEAHDILGKTPLVQFHFMWLISATYPALTHMGYGSRSNMLYGVREMFVEEYMNMILIRSTSEFVQQSFMVPPPVEHYYMCMFNRRLAVIQPYLTASVQEKINANDIRGAIVELGGKEGTEADIVELVTKEIKKDIHNKEIELKAFASMMMSNEQRESRTTSLNADLQRLRDKLTSIIDRVTLLEEKSCPICYESYTNPIMLDCTHIFCGGCLMGWMKNGSVCPTCRTHIRTSHLHAIVSQVETESDGSGDKVQQEEQKSKEDKVLDIIQKKPDGKFLIFSRIDAAFYSIMNKLTSQGISYIEMKGSTAHMMRALESFKQGHVKVILLSTYHAGSGIDISCASDVILLHSMGVDRDQAVGRAQRQGRTTQLHIHSLLYPHEAANTTTV
jgi:SNF2 family DNA or RNA helicase